MMLPEQESLFQEMKDTPARFRIGSTSVGFYMIYRVYSDGSEIYSDILSVYFNSMPEGVRLQLIEAIPAF